MASHSGAFCSSGATLFKAGANHKDITELQMNDIHTEVDSFINDLARFNFTDNYASLNADVKFLLSGIASDLTGMYVIQYDMTDYNTRSEAQTMLNVLSDAALRGMSIIRDKKVQDFMKNA